MTLSHDDELLLNAYLDGELDPLKMRIVGGRPCAGCFNDPYMLSLSIISTGGEDVVSS